jgi:SAM-dependent methyltransferase
MKKSLDVDNAAYTLIKHCRLCNSGNIETVLDFGLVPLANSYPECHTQCEDYYPLTVMKCKDCGHVQLRETINPEILFAKYSYASSDSPSLVKHFHEFARTVTSKLKLDEFDSILEVGCNDGILLKEFVSLGFVNLYGVEPADNIAEKAMGIGAVIFNQFWNADSSKRIRDSHGRMSLVCANNVFAHVADVEGMARGVADILTEDGVFVFENAYLLDTIKGLYFDQVYHEHLQYYGIQPLQRFLARFDMEIFDIEHVATQGGSFRIYAKRKKSTKWAIQPSVEQWVDAERAYNLYENRIYVEFEKKIKALSSQVKAFVAEAANARKTISCYGCPAKFALFSKVFGLTAQQVRYVVDDSPLKFGRFSPGKRIPIVNGQHFADNPTDVCIVSVWNMADAVIARNPGYKGQWVVPMPEFRTI